MYINRSNCLVVIRNITMDTSKFWRYSLLLKKFIQLWMKVDKEDVMYVLDIAPIHIPQTSIILLNYSFYHNYLKLLTVLSNFSGVLILNNLLPLFSLVSFFFSLHFSPSPINFYKILNHDPILVLERSCSLLSRLSDLLAILSSD